MKTGKEKLIEYIESKTKIIKESLDIEYTNKEDIKEVEQWSESKCNYIYDEMKKYIMTGYTESIGTWSCPWCIINNVICSKCNYRKRHKNDKIFVCNISIDPHPSKITNEMYKNIIKTIEGD